MDFIKGADGQVDKIIDQAADVAKEKIGSVIGGGDKKTPKDKKQEGGVGDVITGAIGKAASDAAGNKAADSAKSFGKSLFK